MNRHTAVKALEKIAAGADNGFSKVRRFIGSALDNGGKALWAQGILDQNYKIHKFKNLMRDAPTLAYRDYAHKVPEDVHLYTSPEEQRENLMYSMPDIFPFSRPVNDWLKERAVEGMVDQIQRGYNAFYRPRVYNPTSDSVERSLLLPKYHANESTLGHELGHYNADKEYSERGDSYAMAVNDARKKDFAILPQDMFTVPSTNSITGVTTIPGLEREAWDKAPEGFEIDPRVREAALDTYYAGRKANAKATYGQLLSFAGKLVKPKEK